MISYTTEHFWKCYASLPQHVKVQARAAYREFARDPSHPGLRFKPIGREPSVFSARISLGYRALGQVDGNTIVWFWIGSHTAYERMIAGL